MTKPWKVDSVTILQGACPTCGCEARDDIDDVPTKRFMRRLAWAGKAIGATLKVHGKRLADGTFEWIHIDIKRSNLT